MTELKIVFTDGHDFKKLKTLAGIRKADIEFAESVLTEAKRKERLLSAYLKRKYVGEWKTQGNGKPYSENVFFNVSHCDGAVVIALSDREVGVDIERVRAVKSDLTQYVVGSAEKSKINSHEDFFKVWTGKESLVKAEGNGITVKPDKIPSFPIDGVREYNGKEYRSKSVKIRDYILSVTLLGSEEFSLTVSEEMIGG